MAEAKDNMKNGFTETQILALVRLAERSPDILEMYDNYRTIGKVGRFFWKVGFAAGAVITAIATFKTDLIALFSAKGG